MKPTTPHSPGGSIPSIFPLYVYQAHTLDNKYENG